MRLRRARASDAASVVELIRRFAEKNVMLGVSTDYVLEHLNHYFTAVESGNPVGVVFLRPYSPVLAEIRSLAVAPEYQGKGTGKRLVRHALKEARKMGIRKVFALTLVPGFFQKLGFREEPKENFPEKIWTDCSSCAKKDNCDEVTLSVTLSP